jgi:hypothetical protein
MSIRLPLGSDVTIARNGAAPVVLEGGILWFGDIWSFTDYGYSRDVSIVDLVDNAVKFFCGPGGKRLWFGSNWGSDSHPLDVTDQLALRGHTIVHWTPTNPPPDPDDHDFLVTGTAFGYPGGSDAGRRDWTLNTFLGTEAHGVMLTGTALHLFASALISYCGLAYDNDANDPMTVGSRSPAGYSEDVAPIFDGTSAWIYQCAAFSESGSPTTGVVEVVPWGSSPMSAIWRP